MSTTSQSQTQDMMFVFSKPFYQILCDIYQSKNKFYMTRKQIGEALEYRDSQNSLDQIHRRNSDRLDKFSVTVKLSGTDGKTYDTVVYNLRGVMEICRFSRQPKADEFMDFVWDIMESLFNGETVLSSPSNSDQPITKLQTDIESLMCRVSQLENTQTLQALQTPNDLIHYLIDLRQDTSHNGNATYRFVYKRMYEKKAWNRLLIEYKHKHGVIHATKATLVADDPNVRDFYKQTIRDIINDLKENNQVNIF